MSHKKQKHVKMLFWIGQMASYLCLVHCLATVALTFTAPSLLRLMPHNNYVEYGAWAFVLVSSLFLLSRAPKRKWHPWTLGIIFSWGTLALFFHNHSVFASAFMTLALFQLYLTLSHHMTEHTGDDECCTHPEHPHHHHKSHSSKKGKHSS